MADDRRIDSIAGLRFNEGGVAVPDDQIQATWRRQVEAERAWNLDQRARVCPHGINTDSADCGRCLSLQGVL